MLCNVIKGCEGRKKNAIAGLVMIRIEGVE